MTSQNEERDLGLGVVKRLRDSLADAPFATLVSTVRDPYGTIERLHQRHGDFFPLRLPGMPTIHVVAEPNAVREIMGGSYAQLLRYSGGVELLLGRDTLVLMQDEPHRQRRKLMNPSFNAESVRAFGKTMLEITDRALDAIVPTTVIPLLSTMQEITLRVIMRCAFGVGEGPRFERLRTWMIDYLGHAFGPEMLVLAAVLTPDRARRTMRRLAERARKAPPDAPFSFSSLPLLRVAERLGRIQSVLDAEIERGVAEASGTRKDVLALLVQARFEDGRPMPHDELCEQLLMLLIGGYETTSVALCWAVHCLLSHPEALARVRAEIAEVMPHGFDPGRVRELSYLGAAIQESLRLYPIAAGASRELKSPMKLGGRELPAGSIVMASIYLTHRHPALWDEPARFRPERMLERKPPAHLFFPFGGGAWRCLGAAFAEHEMRIVIARLCMRFEIESAPGIAVRAEQRGITIRPTDGLPVRVVASRDAP